MIINISTHYNTNKLATIVKNVMKIKIVRLTADRKSVV